MCIRDSSKRGITRSKHHAPCHAPWTRTTVVFMRRSCLVHGCYRVTRALEGTALGCRLLEWPEWSESAVKLACRSRGAATNVCERVRRGFRRTRTASPRVHPMGGQTRVAPMSSGIWAPVTVRDSPPASQSTASAIVSGEAKSDSAKMAPREAA